MRVAIAGAGNVGRSIAGELVLNGHEVLLIEREPRAVKPESVPGADWLLADACELETLVQASFQTCQVVVAATGDDKVNLVVSFLAKTEFAIARTVARVNNPRNEWLFNDSWGVDVAVSTPRLMTALVEEAVAVGDLVRLFQLQHGSVNMVELTLPEDSPHAGHRLGDIALPPDVTLVTILRDGRAISPSPDEAVEGGDEILFMCPPEAEHQLALALNPDSRQREHRDADE